MKKLIIRTLHFFGLIPIAKRINSLINYSFNVTISGTKITIPKVYGMQCDVDEKWMTDVLKLILDIYPGAFMDIGVNLGQTLIQVKAIEKEREYIGFEPNPNCIFYLELLMAKNNFKNCHIIPSGLFTKDSIMKLDLYGDDLTNSGGSLIKGFRDFRKNNRVHKEIFVPVFKFENLNELFNSSSIQVIKIDVEGSELEVLESIYNLLEKSHPVILLEVLPVYSSENISRLDRQTRVQGILEKLGYLFFRIIKDKKNDFIGLLKVNEFGIHSDLNKCDYVILDNAHVNVIQKFIFKEDNLDESIAG